MKKGIYTLILIGFLSSCGNNQSSDKTQTVQDNKILKETAYVQLDSYEYQDNTNGDFSGGSKNGRTIKVSGSTNFPDGTVIEIQTSGFIVSSKESGMSDTYKEVKVKDGKFLATLNPWNITDTIEFRIFTNKQSKDILDIVGKTGEKIKINPANKDDFPQIVLFQSDNYAVNEDIISKIKGEKSKDYKFQTASELNKPYEKVLAEFAKSWKDKDWKVMATYCQPSANTKSLAPLFDLVSILGFEVISSKQGTPLPSGNIIMEVEFSAVVKSVNGMKGIQSKKLKANVIQENGKWGVNPTSVTRNLYD